MSKKKRVPQQYGALVSVFITYAQAEAVLIRARLEDAGIPAMIQQESASSALPLSVGPMGEIHITVNAENVEAAREIITDLLVSDAAENDDTDLSGSDFPA